MYQKDKRMQPRRPNCKQMQANHTTQTAHFIFRTYACFAPVLSHLVWLILAPRIRAFRRKAFYDLSRWARSSFAAFPIRERKKMLTRMRIYVCATFLPIQCQALSRLVPLALCFVCACLVKCPSARHRPRLFSHFNRRLRCHFVHGVSEEQETTYKIRQG